MQRFIESSMCEWRSGRQIKYNKIMRLCLISGVGRSVAKGPELDF